MIGSKIFTAPVVRGISVTLPKNRLAVRDILADGRNLDNTLKTTGIEEVRHGDADKTPVDYVVNAAEHLFRDLDFDKSQIDAIVFSSPMEDYITVGNGYLVQSRLNLAEKCIVIDLKQACAGFIHGLFQASMLIQMGYCKNILVCSGDMPSKFINPKDSSLWSIMSDGAAVAIVSLGAKATESTFSFFNDGKYFKALYLPAGGKKLPTKHGVTDVEETDKYGNIRTLENPHMNGLDVMIFVMDAVPVSINDALKIIGWQKDEVDKFYFHQANATILKTLVKRLRLPKEKVSIHLKHYGNTGSVSIPLTLCADNALNAGRGQSLSKVILCGFGNGLSCATATLNLENTYLSEVHEL